MRAKRAKLLRKIMSQGAEPTTYQHVITPRNILTPTGVVRMDMVTIVSTGARRAYQLSKRIWNRYGVMPRLQP